MQKTLAIEAQSFDHPDDREESTRSPSVADLPARNAGAGLALVDARQTGGQRRELPEVPRRDHPLRPPAGRYGGPHGSRAGPGDVCVIQPGHDAWSVGDKPNVLLELATAVRETATPA